jgi:hypothetical protein
MAFIYNLLVEVLHGTDGSGLATRATTTWPASRALMSRPAASATIP